ncbi:nucleotidyltransferase domain-containing protein [bacterium]|nr:nucleotidyltransferase domain-containing protein [bacterium]
MGATIEGDRTVEEILQEIVARIVDAVHPDKIILFGSYARGEANEHSDLDLMVIAPSDTPPGKRTKPILRALRGILFPKDVVWYTPQEMDEWRGVRSHLVGRVLQEGRLLYEKSA